ncbi:MAG TPA: APC family permease [Actinomycetota bacterium]|nr:APC family permease [Actinomycetota bacterium]
MSNLPAALKRVLLGRPMSSGELEHTLLPKVIALPVFSSDPLSSNAYATQEALIVLATAGAAGMSLIFPISVAVATLLAIVVISYRQTVKAYPTGGGAYRVSHENLGKYPGLLAGSALLIDYNMTVSVSIAAGVEAITSVSETLAQYRVPMAIGFVLFVTVINLRGVRESGTLFAIPTYGFVASILLMVGTGIVQCLGGCEQAASASRMDDLHVTSSLTFLLVLKAFAAGTTALTGVEAIADGVPAFRYPQSKNAATTLGIMAALSITMFLGISWLTDHLNVVYTHEPGGHQPSVLSQVAETVFHGGPLFYLVQATSAAILILAANTAYQDFPRLASILAADRYLPRQFMNRGDRLVFSNGVIILAVVSSTLIYVFQGNLTRLIQLYLVGVFISFTLSQTGMVVRGRRLKEPGWQRRAALSAFGACVTGVVLVVIASTKFAGGAWIVLIAIPVLMFTMRSVNKHYVSVEAELAHPSRRPADRRPADQHMIVYVTTMDAAVERALGYARAMRAAHISAVTFDSSHIRLWKRLAPDVPIEVVPQGTRRTKAMRAFLTRKRAELQLDHDAFLTLVIPEVLESTSLFEIFRRPALHRLKGALLTEPGVQVLDVPVVRKDIDPHLDQSHEPGRNYTIVLVSGVHNATLQAFEYAETLQSIDVRAVSFGLDEQQTDRLVEQWASIGIPHPLEIEASPFRDIGTSLVHYLRQFRADGLERTVTVVLPEFVVKKTRHQILHNQTALIVKRRLLFERGTVVVSVPYHLER